MLLPPPRDSSRAQPRARRRSRGQEAAGPSGPAAGAPGSRRWGRFSLVPLGNADCGDLIYTPLVSESTRYQKLCLQDWSIASSSPFSRYPRGGLSLAGVLQWETCGLCHSWGDLGLCEAGGIAWAPDPGPVLLQVAASCNAFPKLSALSLTIKLDFFFPLSTPLGNLLLNLHNAGRFASFESMFLPSSLFLQLAYLTPAFLCSAKIPVPLPALSLPREGGDQGHGPILCVCQCPKAQNQNGAANERLCYEVFKINLMP